MESHFLLLARLPLLPLLPLLASSATALASSTALALASATAPAPLLDSPCPARYVAFLLIRPAVSRLV
jgi:hypothetical protein